jgi:hypothetical protein
MLRSVAGSIFFASQCAAALSSTVDMLVRNCTKMGTEVLYIEIVMKCGSFGGRLNAEERKLSGLSRRCHFLTGIGRTGMSALANVCSSASSSSPSRWATALEDALCGLFSIGMTCKTFFNSF